MQDWPVEHSKLLVIQVNGFSFTSSTGAGAGMATTDNAAYSKKHYAFSNAYNSYVEQLKALALSSLSPHHLGHMNCSSSHDHSAVYSWRPPNTQMSCCGSMPTSDKHHIPLPMQFPFGFHPERHCLYPSWYSYPQAVGCHHDAFRGLSPSHHRSLVLPPTVHTAPCHKTSHIGPDNLFFQSNPSLLHGSMPSPPTSQGCPSQQASSIPKHSAARTMNLRMDGGGVAQRPCTPSDFLSVERCGRLQSNISKIE